MNVDQNSDEEAKSDKTDSSKTKLDVRDEPGSSSDQHSSSEIVNEVILPEFEKILNELSLTNNQEEPSSPALQSSDSDETPQDSQIAKVFSRTKLNDNLNLQPLTEPSTYLKEIQEHAVGLVKIFSKINVSTSREQSSSLRNNAPVDEAKLKRSPESTNLLDRANRNLNNNTSPITEQPRRKSFETEQIYLSPNPLRESESIVHITNLETNISTTLRAFPNIPAIPPSYSTVIKFPPPEQRRPLTNSDFSFSTRVPPPSYAQVQGIWTESASTRSSEEVLYGPEPQYAECPRCTVIVITETRFSTSKLTHFTALGLCLMGCWPCCLLPYFMESCKDTYHYCPVCHHCFGVYTPW